MVESCKNPILLLYCTIVKRLPTNVPLPEVNQYADELTIGNLGLPVGFDDERLLVNLRAFHRVRAVAGLGDISIVGTSGDVGGYDYQIGSTDESGTASLGAVSKRHNKPLSSANISWPLGTSSFGKPDVTVEVNNSETQEQVKDVAGSEGLFDAKVERGT